MCLSGYEDLSNDLASFHCADALALLPVGWTFLFPIMSSAFPHTSYAEDQPLSTVILTTHVLDRGFQSGALLGLLYGAGRSIFSRGVTNNPAFLSIPLLRSTGVGGAVGVGLMIVGLPIRMWGREEIEWKDRAWRLQENRGQLEGDKYSTTGTVAGLAVAASSNSIRKSGLRPVLGGAGVGSLIGVIGYMA